VTPLGIVALSLLCGMAAVMGALAIRAIIRVLLPGPHRDRCDEDRVLLTYVDTWDLPGPEIRKMSRLGIGRAYCAILRLESQGLLDSYWHRPLGSDTRRFMESTAGKWIVEAGELKGMGRGDVSALKACLSRQRDEARMGSGSRNTGTRRYVLTNLGREAVYDLERTKIDEIHNDRHGA
jgi:hypothetical protein